MFSLAPISPGSASGKRLPLLNLLSFIGVLVLNALASTGALSQYDVGEVSRQYQTLITPAGYAFSIWGVIYFSVAVFVVWQCVPSWRDDNIVFGAIGYWFVLSCVSNVLWIIIFVQASLLAVWTSSVLLFLIFGSLLQIILRVRAWERAFLPSTADSGALLNAGDFASSKGAIHERRSSAANMEEPMKQSPAKQSLMTFFAVDWAFSIYCGWTTAASILNVACSLIGSGYYGGPNVSQEAWAVIMLTIATLLYSVMIVRKSNWAYGFVFTWAAIAISKGEQCAGDVATADGGYFNNEEACSMVQTCAYVEALIITVLSSVMTLRYAAKVMQAGPRPESVTDQV